MAINIDKGVLKGLALLIGVVALIGSLFIALYIWAIVGGAVSYAAINGSLPVTSGTTTFLGTAETAFFANLTSIQTAAAVAGGLLVLAIILILFASFIKTGKEVYGEMKKKSGRNTGDMGY